LLSGLQEGMARRKRQAEEEKAANLDRLTRDIESTGT
jgi:hypothetical protein